MPDGITGLTAPAWVIVCQPSGHPTERRNHHDYHGCFHSRGRRENGLSILPHGTLRQHERHLTRTSESAASHSRRQYRRRSAECARQVSQFIITIGHAHRTSLNDLCHLVVNGLSKAQFEVVEKNANLRRQARSKFFCQGAE
jgi:hypothetical protein